MLRLAEKKPSGPGSLFVRKDRNPEPTSKNRPPMAVLHLLGARKGEVWAQRLTCTCRGRRVGGDAPRVLGKDESIPRLGRSSCGPGRAWSWGPRLSDKEMSRASKCYSGFKKTKRKQLSVVSPQRDFHPQMCICVFALFLVVRGVCVCVHVRERERERENKEPCFRIFYMVDSH